MTIFYKKNNAFTVVELLVAMSVFVVLMGIITGIFINSLRVQKSLVSFMAVNDSVSIALEGMARELRTGSDFCISDPSDNCLSSVNGASLKFKNALDKDVVYRLNQGLLEKSDTGGASFSSITPNNINVSGLEFELVDQKLTTGIGDEWPPRINIFLKVGSRDPNLIGVTTNLQITVSGRNFE